MFVYQVDSKDHVKIVNNRPIIVYIYYLLLLFKLDHEQQIHGNVSNKQ